MKALAVLLLLTGIASAQTSQDKAAADALFDEAKQLLAAGQIDKACTKLAASLKLAEQLGTRLNLADCYEKAGRTASAWAEFRQASSLAATKNDAREEFARQRAETLAPKLVKLTISVAVANRVAGLTVTRDGVAVQEGLYDTAVPVDPGAHEIAASADGYRPWSQKITVAGDAGTMAHVNVPALVAMPKVIVAPLAEAHAGKGQRTAGLVVAVTGVAVTAVGLIFGAVASSKWSDAKSACPTGTGCSANALALHDTASSDATLSTVFTGIGVAAIATGVIVYLTAPKGSTARESAWRVTPTVGNTWGLAIGGGF